MRYITAVAICLAGVAVACGSPEPGIGATRLACDHFRNASVEFSDGVLTNSEMRSKLQEVDRNARASHSPRVQNASRDLLRAFTQNDNTAVTVAVVEMQDACIAAGH